MKLHQTAGGILFNKTLDKVFLIHKIERDEWLLPKGHIEDGESVLQAAKREIREETGYSNFILLGNEPVHVSDFRFKDGDELARKKVQLFTAILVDNGKQKTQEMKTEGLSGKWFAVDNAKKVVEYDDIAQSIQSAYDQIKSLSNS